MTGKPSLTPSFAVLYAYPPPIISSNTSPPAIFTLVVPITLLSGPLPSPDPPSSRE